MKISVKKAQKKVLLIQHEMEQNSAIPHQLVEVFRPPPLVLLIVMKRRKTQETNDFLMLGEN